MWAIFRKCFSSEDIHKFFFLVYINISRIIILPRNPFFSFRFFDPLIFRLIITIISRKLIILQTYQKVYVQITKRSIQTIINGSQLFLETPSGKMAFRERRTCICRLWQFNGKYWRKCVFYFHKYSGYKIDKWNWFWCQVKHE